METQSGLGDALETLPKLTEQLVLRIDFPEMYDRENSEENFRGYSCPSSGFLFVYLFLRVDIYVEINLQNMSY